MLAEYHRSIIPGNDAPCLCCCSSRVFCKSGQAVRVATLVDSDATRDNILCGLRRLASDAQNPPSCSSTELNNLQPTNIEDRVYIFFSGHGAAQTLGFCTSAERRLVFGSGR